MVRLVTVLVCLLSVVPMAAQSSDPPAPAPAAATAGIPTASTPAEDKRIYGVLPNNRMTENSYPFRMLTPKEKFTIALKDSVDIPVYPTAALFAGLYQLENSNPSFGQGVAGYARRFGTAYGDQVIGNVMTEGLFPAVFHLDPRYFRLGEGGKGHRAFYAVEQIFVTKTDSGSHAFNVEEWGGNATAVAISNAYYPDTRDWKDNAQKLLIQCATDAFSNVLKEFWPDVKAKLHKKKDTTAPVAPPTFPTPVSAAH
ncbi:MAG TPA: hypothetical protein VML19_01160 [Verrucomicrobiae bacterium]|nr:hypothetical protein [Verrucomicrobiae bacterium]